MSYATTDDIISMFRNLDTTVSNPAVTVAEIQDFIDENESIIDAKIGTLYTLPITQALHPQSFLILKRLTKYGVACIVDDILNDYGEADKKPMWCKKFQMLMDELVPPFDKKTCKQCEPTMKLPDADYLGTAVQRGRLKVSATEGTVFKKGQDNW